MFFTRYFLAAAAVEMLGQLPQCELVRNLRMRARRARIARMKDIRAWHLAELRRLGSEHRIMRHWHRAQAEHWHFGLRDQRRALARVSAEDMRAA